MAETRNPTHTDVVRMDGALGPWTINLPPGFHGAQIGLATRDAVPATVTLNANGTDTIRAPDGTSQSSWSDDLIRESLNLVFHGADGLSEWFLSSAGQQPVVTLGDVASNVPIGDVDTRLNLTYRTGDAEIFTFNPDGTITCNYTLPSRIINLNAYLVVDLTIAANNQMINNGFSWRRVSGTGAVEYFPGGVAFGHSRTTIVSVDAQAAAIYSPVAGDIFELYGWEVDSDGASAGEVIDGTISIEVV